MTARKKKVIYIISFIQKALIYDWQIEYFSTQGLIDVKYIILNPFDSPLSDKVKESGLTLYQVKYRGKRDLFFAIKEVIRILRKEKPDFVNTNLFDAGIVGQIASYLVGVPSRIHSRHYSSIHHMFHRQAIIYDKILNRISTKIVVATEMVKKFMIERESADPKKIHVINYGFDLNSFDKVEQSRITKVMEKYEVKTHSPVIGVISRFIEWKGIQYIIPAYKKFLSKYPNALLLLANAVGDYEVELNNMLEQLPKHSFRKITFENDSPALYKLFDIFVHVPIDYHSEAFGQIYVEALAAGIPSVFTYSGVAHDFIIDKRNALVVPYKDENAICKAMDQLIIDKDLYNDIKSNGKESAYEKFGFENMMNKTMKLYK